LSLAPSNLDKGILTFRERQVARLASEAYTNKQMAIVLHISLKTVETHRASIMSKLHLGSFASLVRYALRNKY
jgi:DNA-binding NarL/FixJ family response regulator